MERNYIKWKGNRDQSCSGIKFTICKHNTIFEYDTTK